MRVLAEACGTVSVRSVPEFDVLAQLTGKRGLDKVWADTLGLVGGARSTLTGHLSRGLGSGYG